MEHKAKSIIIGRMKRKSEEDLNCPCFVSLFQIHQPHKSGQVPDKILNFENIRKIELHGLDIEYQLAGNDIIVDNLSSVSIAQKGEVIVVTGKQKK